MSEPEEALVIDAQGNTVIPGFIDAHVHIGFADPADVLRRGVTTVRDLGWPPHEIWPLATRSKDELGWPEIIPVGPMVTVANGYPISAGWAPPGTGLAIASPEEGRATVRELRDAGSWFVKVALNPLAGPVLDKAQLQAIVEEAHAHELRVTAHVHDLEHLELALEAGIDELAHMLLSGEMLPDELIDELVARQVMIVPTMSVFREPEVSVAIDNLARFLGAGGWIVYGTDLGNAGPQPGIDPTEVRRMSEAGMSPRDIVVAATYSAAAWLDFDWKGYISEGCEADIVILEGPLENASDLTRVKTVIRKGKVAA